MEEGVFSQWLKREGDRVQAGEMLYVLEGEKAASDIESFDSGILHIPANAPAPGDRVIVGQRLGYLLQPGETPPAAGLPTADSAAAGLPAAPQLGTDAPTAVGAAGRAVAISPRARRVAAELGIEISQVHATGSTGRIRESDVRAAAAAKPNRRDAGEEGTLSKPTAIRAAIALRLQESLRNTVPVTLTTRADATQWMALRERLKAAQGAGPVPSFNDLFIKLAARALRQFPELATQWRGEDLFIPTHVHVAFAVDTPSGLVAPVVRDADRMGLREIAAHTADLIARARAGRLRPEEMTGATFTLSHLGAFGIDAFTPVIDWPQCAILGIGRISAEPAVVDGLVVVRQQMTLSLTVDHRRIDGAPAARFLARIRDTIAAAPADLET